MILTRHGRVAVLALAVALTAVGAPAVAAPPPPPAPPAGPGDTRGPGGLAEAIVQIGSGHTVGELAASVPLVVEKTLLGSRGIYLVSATDRRFGADDRGAQRFADALTQSGAVAYAEPNLLVGLDDTRFHAWGNSTSTTPITDPAAWTQQPAVTTLQLGAAHLISGGAGVTVAVLDTGVDPDHPALSGRLTAGWDYVDDDSDPTDEPSQADEDGDGQVDDAYGHGTFVAGTIALVAPDATIMPERVLDAEGYGNVFVVAQAIIDAVNAGANIVNLSLGTATPIPSRLLSDAIAYAGRHGVLVVAAAGNDFTDHPHFPAANPGVLSVSALDADSDGLASYADYGPWVDVAAPGTAIVGPVPGGGYAVWDGTSMATPFVAGQAALLRAATPAATSTTLTDRIGQTARKLGRTRLAFGRIDIMASLTTRGGPPPP